MKEAVLTVAERNEPIVKCHDEFYTSGALYTANADIYPINGPEMYQPIIIVKPEMVHIDAEARLDSFVKVEGGLGVTIGRWVHIASFCHINVGGGEVIMEEGSAAASGCRIIGGSNLISGVSCSAKAPKEMQQVKRSRTVIGKNAVLFCNAVIMPGVTVGEGAAVAAGAVVTHDVPAFEIWAGVPARKIGMRPCPPPSK